MRISDGVLTAAFEAALFSGVADIALGVVGTVLAVPAIVPAVIGVALGSVAVGVVVLCVDGHRRSLEEEKARSSWYRHYDP
jgi:hypothetical protein